MKYLGPGRDFGLSRLSNIGDGINPTDAVSLQQMQSFLDGKAWKEPVRAASNTPVTLTAPGANIGGVAMAANDRVLLMGQTDATQNGIYVWTASGATLSRSTDNNTAAKMKSATTSVAEGTFADKSYTQTADNVTLGTTPLAWVQSSGQNYVAGNGITLSAGTISALADPAAGSGIVVTSTGIKIDTAVVTRKFATTIGDGAATSYTVTHNLATVDVIVRFYLVSTGEEVDVDVTARTANTVTIVFNSAPASNTVRAVVMG